MIRIIIVTISALVAGLICYLAVYYTSLELYRVIDEGFICMAIGLYVGFYVCCYVGKNLNEWLKRRFMMK